MQDLAKFKLSVAAKAAGVSASTVRGWLLKGNIFLDDTGRDVAAKKGLPRAITFASVMRIALMARVTQTGIAASRAWRIVMAYTEIGDAVIYWEGQEIPKTQRPPGRLYQTGRTLLIGAGADDFGHVVNWEPTTNITELLNRLEGHAVAVVVDVGQVQYDVLTKLMATAEWTRK